MDELLETITEAETINPKFRVWITTEAHPHFPISVLQVQQILIPQNIDLILCFLKTSSITYIILYFINVQHFLDFDVISYFVLALKNTTLLFSEIYCCFFPIYLLHSVGFDQVYE